MNHWALTRRARRVGLTLLGLLAVCTAHVQPAAAKIPSEGFYAASRRS